MTIDEKIKLLESRIAETDKLLAEIRKEKKNEEKKNTESILAEYWNRINSGEKVFYLDGYNAIIESEFIDADDEKYNDNNTDRYSNYPIKEYAEQAQKIKEFNDKLLAFKWCYDRDYKPVFSGDYNNRAYYIYYDSEYKEYNCDWGSVYERNIIYFSSAKIAQKCCDWLNEELTHGELEEE